MKPQFWHMQMFPGNEPEFAEKVPSILEHHKIIGLGDWDEKAEQIPNFCEQIQVNDIVAIKNGAKLIALVQVIGGMYEVNDDESELGWIIYRRPIRVLDWALNGETLPHTRGTLVPCISDDAETNKIIKNWYEKVKHSFEQRNIPITV